MEYEVLLFDSDDTLLDFKAAEKNALRLALTECGLEYNDALALSYSKANDVYWKAFEKGEIEKKEIYVGRFQLFLKNANIDFDPKTLSEKYEGFLKKQYNKIEGAQSTCEMLYEKYDMYIVSNGNVKVQLPRLEGSGLRPFFKDVFVSEAIGFQKPQKEFFDYIFKKISVTDLSKILIIGDSITSDIQGGINAGIDTCLFSSTDNKSGVKPTYTVRNHTELRQLLERN